mmetsp:Transcript_97669/g.259466  ORF Transcript_97669/g.259466 Transcript_97669/m.259466 type:complete len:226 (-) Transcript_97669:110-787(-)
MQLPKVNEALGGHPVYASQYPQRLHELREDPVDSHDVAYWQRPGHDARGGQCQDRSESADHEHLLPKVQQGERVQHAHLLLLEVLQGGVVASCLLLLTLEVLHHLAMRERIKEYPRRRLLCLVPAPHDLTPLIGEARCVNNVSADRGCSHSGAARARKRGHHGQRHHKLNHDGQDIEQQHVLDLRQGLSRTGDDDAQRPRLAGLQVRRVQVVQVLEAPKRQPAAA